MSANDAAGYHDGQMRAQGRIELRPAEAPDDPFLRRLHAGTYALELAAMSLAAAEEEAFLAMQYEAQGRHYRTAFPRAEHLVVTCEGEPIGRLYLNRGSDEHRIVDIVLLAEHRNRGIGSTLITKVIDEATRAGKPVRLHVARSNPARRLYERLGFIARHENEVHVMMEHPAPAS